MKRRSPKCLGAAATSRGISESGISDRSSLNSPTNPGGAGFDEWLSGLNFFDNDPYLSRNGNYVHPSGPGSVITMDATIEFLTKHHDGDKPMFAVTWFPSPHDPQQELPQGIENAATLYNDQQTKKPGYYREITLLDQQVGRLRKTLRQLGVADDTLLFYCSDNGGLVEQSSGGRAKKGSIYEGGLRVPAILEWPARFGPQEVDTPAFVSDLYPTLVALTGARIDQQPPLDGVDLMPVLRGEQTARPPMGFWHGHTSGQGTYSDRIIRAPDGSKASGEAQPSPRANSQERERVSFFRQRCNARTCRVERLAVEASPDSKRRRRDV